MELQSWLLYHFVAVTDCNQVMPSTTAGEAYPDAGSGSRTRNLSLRVQKKLLSRFAASSAGRVLFIDDDSTLLLDHLYKIMESAVKSCPNLDKKQPEKVLKNIIKLSIKVGLLHRNQQLRPEDDVKISEIRVAVKAAVMSVVSFHELEFSFDKAYLKKLLERCRAAVQDLIRPHLTDKSLDRCDQIFDFLTHDDFLDSAFLQDPEHRAALDSLVNDINKSFEEGRL